MVSKLDKPILVDFGNIRATLSRKMLLSGKNLNNLEVNLKHLFFHVSFNQEEIFLEEEEVDEYLQKDFYMNIRDDIARPVARLIGKFEFVELRLVKIQNNIAVYVMENAIL